MDGFNAPDIRQTIQLNAGFEWCPVNITDERTGSDRVVVACKTNVNIHKCNIFDTRDCCLKPVES